LKDYEIKDKITKYTINNKLAIKNINKIREMWIVTTTKGSKRLAS